MYNPYYSPYTQPNFNAGVQSQAFTQPQPNIAQNGSQGFTQPMPYQMPQMPMQQANSNIEYVNGIEGAKALILPPNATRIMLDSDRKYFYIKTTDMNGKPTIEAHPYMDEEPTAEPQPIGRQMPQYVTLSQYEEQQKIITGLQAEIEKLKRNRNNNQREDRK